MASGLTPTPSRPVLPLPSSHDGQRLSQPPDRRQSPSPRQIGHLARAGVLHSGIFSHQSSPVTRVTLDLRATEDETHAFTLGQAKLQRKFSPARIRTC